MAAVSWPRRAQLHGAVGLSLPQLSVCSPAGNSPLPSPFIILLLGKKEQRRFPCWVPTTPLAGGWGESDSHHCIAKKLLVSMRVGQALGVWG